MSNGTLQHLKPIEKLIFFIVFCLLSGALFSFLSVGVATKLFSVSLEDFSNITNAQSIHAIKLTNLFFHLGTFIFPAIIFSKLFAHNPDDYLRLKEKIVWNKIILIIIMLLGLVMASDFLFYINKLIDFSFLPRKAYSQLIYEQAVRDKTVYAYIGATYKSLVSNIVLLALIPALGEELVFRGVFQHLLAKITKRVHFSVWATGFLFAFIHFQFIDFLPRFMLGVAFGYVVVYTGSLWYSILLHFLNNLLFVLVEFLIKKNILNYSFRTPSGLNYYIAGIALVAITYVFFKLRKTSKFYEMKGVYLR